MSSYKSAVYPEPDRRDSAKMKEFFNLKYKQRRFAKNEEESSESEDSEEEDKKKKKKKEEKKQKKSHKKEESGSESDSIDEKKKAANEGKGLGKLMAPPGKKGTKFVEKTAPIVQPTTVDFLEFDT